MKKGIILLTLVAGCYFGLNSFVNGPAANGYDCTGAETGLGNPTGCATGAGTGCHSTVANPGISLTLKIDSAGNPINFYTPGKTYTLTVTGMNNVDSSVILPKFGFQVGVISGGEPSAMAVNAGALQSMYLPYGVRYKAGNLANYRVNLLEHNFPLNATTGGGAMGSTYKESFTWTAPLVGPDTVSVWGVFLAANGDSTESGDRWDTAHIIVTRRPVPASLATLDASSVKIGCNPVYNSLDLLFGNASSGVYKIGVYDMLGKNIAVQQVSVSGLGSEVSIDAANWAPGMYIAVIENSSSKATLQVVKR